MTPLSFDSVSDTQPTRLRQIALVVEDLKQAERVITTILGLPVLYRDPLVAQWGLHNALLPLGGDILELVAPTRPNTSAGRFLAKRRGGGGSGGGGGYMVIMQTADAAARRQLIEQRGLAPVVFAHETDDAVCVQYDPRGLPGGVMPELDGHKGARTGDFVRDRFAPWHACGTEVQRYTAVMRANDQVRLVGVLLRLADEEVDTEAAARRWSEVFGVPLSRDVLAFTNARMGFVRGRKGILAGMESVTLAVKGRERLRGIWERAKAESLPTGDDWVDMCGLRWYFVDAGGAQVMQGSL